VALTAVDVLLFLFLIGRSIKVIEAVVGCLILLITVCFCVQMSMSKPPAIPLLLGFLPSEQIFNDPGCLFVAVGIIGATVMPHNLFLHSSIVLTRSISLDAGTADAAGAAGTGNDDPRSKEGLKEALKYAFWDSTVSLTFAWFVNSSILIVAASAFHRHGYTDIVDLEDAYKLLTPLLGNSAGAYLFAIALLASGQNATLTGTLTGQIVMEGFTSYHVQPFTRRVATRLLAIVPAVIAVSVGGDGSANSLLIFSQVFLSFALPFAIFPLVHITSDAAKMGEFVNGRWTAVAAYLIGLLILSLNVLVFIPR
jgi:manganese transport protein